MANWKHVIDISATFEKEDVCAEELSAVLVKKLEALPEQDKPRELIERFRELSRDEGATDGMFNALLDQLYDWGDLTLPPHDAWPHNKMCFIQT